VWPELYDVEPSPARAGQEVTVRATGGYLYWDGVCGEAWDESARSFQLSFDGLPRGLLECYANWCQADLTVPVLAQPGWHTVAVEGGSALDLYVVRPTPTPTATPDAPEILGFTVDKTEVDPGGSVRLEWASARGVSASLSHWLPFGTLAQEQPVSPSGEMHVTIGNDERWWREFRLTVSDGIGQTTMQSLMVQIRCPFSYFFPRPAGWGAGRCPLRPAAFPWSAEQQFEHGRLIWQEGLPAESTAEMMARGPTIYVLYDSDGSGEGGDLAVFADTWTDAEPESDPGIVPPAGLYQPIRGFGKVWRNNAEVRDRLGWATGPEAGFDGAYQVDWGDPLHVAGSRYIRTRDGGVVWTTEMNTWGVLLP
jgi:hypothetical protein